jgi:hypothetical protein
MNYIQAIKLLNLNQTRVIRSESTGAEHRIDLDGKHHFTVKDYISPTEYILATDWKPVLSWLPESCYQCEENSTLVSINGKIV